MILVESVVKKVMLERDWPRRAYTIIKHGSSKVVNRNEGSLGNEWYRALPHENSAEKSSAQKGKSGQY